MPKPLPVPLLLLALFFAWSIPAAAQQPVSASDPMPGWQRVESLPAGTAIHVNGKPHLACNFRSADADTLTCAHGSSASASPILIPRTSITSIKLAHRGRSALAGMGVGGSVGAIIGFAAGTNKGGFFGPNAFRGAIAAIFAVLGALVGAPVGYFTDFTAGSPIYKAP